jgi:hypothetical protein
MLFAVRAAVTVVLSAVAVTVLLLLLRLSLGRQDTGRSAAGRRGVIWRRRRKRPSHW